MRIARYINRNAAYVHSQNENENNRFHEFRSSGTQCAHGPFLGVITNKFMLPSPAGATRALTVGRFRRAAIVLQAQAQAVKHGNRRQQLQQQHEERLSTYGLRIDRSHPSE